MSIWKRLFGVQTGNDPAEVPIASVKRHLQAMHRHFRSSPNYPASAPYWRKLENTGVLDWLKTCFMDAVGKPGLTTQTTREYQGLVICTVLEAVDPAQIRAAFAPAGYLSHLEAHGFFDAPQQKVPAAAFVLGHEGNVVRVDLTWFPPLDGRAYQVVAAQDILTARERQELGI